MDHPNLRILVVDDDEGITKALGRLLAALGHSVHVSHDAAKSVDLALAVRPHLVLQDLAMPSMDGYEVTRRMKSISALAGTVLIACSGIVDERRVLEAGFDGWLHKPIDVQALQTVLAMAADRTLQRGASASPGAQPPSAN